MRAFVELWLDTFQDVLGALHGGDPCAEAVLHLRRGLAPVEVEVLRRELPGVAAQENRGEDGHHEGREVEAGAAVAGGGAGALRDEGVLPSENERAKDAATLFEPLFDEAERVLREGKGLTEERQTVPAGR